MKKTSLLLPFRLSLLTTLFALCTSLYSQGQDTASVTDGGTANKFKAFLNGGLSTPYTDVKDPALSPHLGLSAAYSVLPDLDINLELNKGWMKAGEPGVENTLGFTNSYVDVLLTARLSPFALIKNPSHNAALDLLSGIFVGTGIGFIAYNAEPNAMPIQPDWNPLDMQQQLDFFLPIEAGIAYPVARLPKGQRLFLQLHYRTHLCFSDKIDGYQPASAGNKKKDAFNTLSLGIGIDF